MSARAEATKDQLDSAPNARLLDPETTKLPRGVRNLPDDERAAWVERYNARFATVDVCPVCGEGLCAEELVAHRINHLEPRLRVLARMVEDADDATKAGLIAYLRDYHRG